MAESKEEKQKRLAQALRANLQRRKAQKRNVDDTEAGSDDRHRAFREKPIKPDRHKS